METVLDRLLAQAYLFDDPGAYEAGVRDAVDAIAAQAVRIAAGKQVHPAGGPPAYLQAVGHRAS